MNNLDIYLKNCFGIGEFKHKFNFTKSKISLIYAPNGTMKTSFARTFDLISKDDSKNLPRDRVYKSRETIYKVLADENKINPNNILVINSEDTNFDASAKISNFLASKELKKEYDEIYQELNSQKNEFIKKLKLISKSTDCEKEIMNTFSDESQPSFFDILLFLQDKLRDDCRKIDFKYNDVFDAKGNVQKFLLKNQSILDQYVNSYKNIISKSNFFKESTDSTFGTYQANEILRSTEDNSFFNAGHTFVLENKTIVNNSEELKNLVQKEIESILNDQELKSSFEKMDKAITNNVELRAFHKVIEKNNLILVDLKDYQGFRKEVWIAFLSEIKFESELLANLYFEKKKELKRIILESKKESMLWVQIIQTFNSRFFVPFKIVLSNQEDIILKKETASLEFEYSDRNDEPVKQDRNSLLGVLSKGEQRAYFILQFLFELESRKSISEVNLLILDDIADSFDYKNKFAIIEYIRDLNDLDNFRIIILTHNFDFYRTIASRLSLPHNVVYMATKNDEKIITLHNGQYRKDVFQSFLQRFSEPAVFVSLIAFVRNLIQYSESESSEDYLTLTSCLHLKEKSKSLSSRDILEIYAKKLSNLVGKSISFEKENIIELIYNTADEICQAPSLNEISLETKISLAIAIRLKSESYLISKLPNLDLTTISINQTQYLCKEYRDLYPQSSSLIVIDKVNLMTPENIHINAFMYEPLIDMSAQHLVDLYQKVSVLANSIMMNEFHKKFESATS